MKEDVEHKLWNIHLIVDEIEAFPQTYDTILKEFRKNGTFQIILRRKLNNLCRNGMVCKMAIPGTRFGKALYFSLHKKYYFLVEANRTGTTVYAFYDYKQESKFYMSVDECWKLDNIEWRMVGRKVFFDGDVLKFL